MYIFHKFEKKVQKIQEGGGGAKTPILRNYRNRGVLFEKSNLGPTSGRE